MLKDLNTDLLDAAQAGNSAEVARLLNLGADANAQNSWGETALIFVGRFSFVNDDPVGTTELLLKASADVNHIVQISGETPLNAACEAPNLELVKLLLRHGASTEAKPNAAYCLYNTSDIDILVELLQFGAHPLDVGCEGASPLEETKRLLAEAIELNDYKERITSFAAQVAILERYAKPNS